MRGASFLKRARAENGVSRRFRSTFSTAVAAVNDEDDDVLSRPRLEALRQQMRREGPVRLSQFPAPKRVSEPVEKPKSTEPSSDSPVDFPALLATLPDVPTSEILHDRFQRKHTYLRLSLTERCNLRCTYCMPEQGVPLQPPEHLLQTPELLRIARYFFEAGVRKFRLTGGEPTLRRDLVDIVAGLSALGPDQIGITTNGITLTKNLPDLAAAGLTSVNISLDTLDADKFTQLTRRPGLDRVLQAIDLAHETLGATGNVKINCVVMRGVNDGEIADFIRLTERYPLLSVRFIEYMPFTDNGWNWDKCVPYQELLDSLPEGLVHKIPEEDPHDTTKWFKTATGSKVGFITSMSSHFCAGCNRLRLGADGTIKVCLFDGNTDISLKDAIRSGLTEPEWGKLIHYALSKKKWSLGGHKDPQDIMRDAANNRPMTLIGG